MSIKITWLRDITGLDLRPTWEVEKARIHTTKMLRDGCLKDTLVLALDATEVQIRKLVADFGAENLPIGLLGLKAIPLAEGQVIWTWKAPKGYEDRLKDGSYTAFEIQEQGVIES